MNFPVGVYRAHDALTQVMFALFHYSVTTTFKNLAGGFT